MLINWYLSQELFEDHSRGASQLGVNFNMLWLRYLKEGIDDSLTSVSPWPDIRPSLLAVRHLCEELCMHPGDIIFTPRMKWSPEVARYLNHLAVFTSPELEGIHELDCISTRTIPRAWTNKARYLLAATIYIGHLHELCRCSIS